MGMLEHEDYGPQRRAAEKAIGQTRDFLVDQATDPLNYLGPAGKGLGVGAKVARGLFATTLAGKAEDANAMFFGGTYIKEGIKKAEQLLKMGLSREDLFKQTGFFKDPQGEWRYYIPDKVVNPKGRLGFADAKGTTKDFLVHPELYKYDPQLKEAKVATKPVAEMSGYEGLYSREGRNISISAGLDLKNKFSVLMHELQHDIQYIGDVSGGSNATLHNTIWNTEKQQKVHQSFNTLKRMFEQKYGQSVESVLNLPYTEWEKLPKEVKNYANDIDKLDFQLRSFENRRVTLAPYAKYSNNPGEVEARITEKLVGRDLRNEKTGLTDLYDLYGKEITAPDYYDNFQFSFD